MDIDLNGLSAELGGTVNAIVRFVADFLQEFHVAELFDGAFGGAIGPFLIQALIIAIVVEVVRRYGVRSTYGQARQSRAKYLGTVVDDLWANLQSLKGDISSLYQGYRVPEHDKKWRGYIYQLSSEDIIQKTALKEDLLRTENSVRQLRHWIYSSYYIFPPRVLARISGFENCLNEIERIVMMLSHHFAYETTDEDPIFYWTERIEDTIEVHTESLMSTYRGMRFS